MRCNIIQISLNPQYKRLFSVSLGLSGSQARGLGGGGLAALRGLAGEGAAASAPTAGAAVEVQAGTVRKGGRALGIHGEVVVESQAVVVVAVELVQVGPSLRSAPAQGHRDTDIFVN